VFPETGLQALIALDFPRGMDYDEHSPPHVHARHGRYWVAVDLPDLGVRDDGEIGEYPLK